MILLVMLAFIACLAVFIWCVAECINTIATGENKIQTICSILVLAVCIRLVVGVCMIWTA